MKKILPENFGLISLCMACTILSVTSCNLIQENSTQLFKLASEHYDKKEFSEAFNKYQKAANGGHAEAMNMVGRMYQNGEGTSLDYQKAMTWFLKGSEAGSSAAMCNIGWMYDKAEGVPEDNLKALTWYRKAMPAITSQTWLTSKKENLQVSKKA